MDSILTSIQPKWCELIMIGEKTIELRKTQLQTPFKCFIYETKGTHKNCGRCSEFDCPIRSQFGCDEGMGAVIGEFICDRIDKYECHAELPYDKYNLPKKVLADMCLNCHDVDKYGNGKTLYGWHISQLVIYDEPRELTRFVRPNANCGVKDCGFYDGKHCCGCPYICDKLIVKRAPQSWCYAEPI